MEPVSGATILTALLKLGAGTASAPISTLLRKRTLRWRVARRVSKVARVNGIQVKPRGLRHWLSRTEVQQQLESGRQDGVDSCIVQLGYVLASTGDEEGAHAQIVMKLIADEYLRAQESADATLLTTQWIRQDISYEGDSTRKAILAAQAAPQFLAEDLLRLHPWRRQDARDLVTRFPLLGELIHSLVREREQAKVLSAWSRNPPQQLDTAPAAVWCWLGTIASDHGENLAAEQFIRGGLARGVTPDDYWRARLLLLSTLDRDGQADESTEPENSHPIVRAHVAILGERFKDCELILEKWLPKHPNNQSIKSLLKMKNALGQKDLNKAISIGISSVELQPEGSGVALLTAELLLSRGYRGTSDHPLTDYVHARALAIRARDFRREWNGDSVGAILVAIKASALSTDVDRAWKLAIGPPDGEATDEEASDSRLINESARTRYCR